MSIKPVNNKPLSISETAKLFNVHVDTLRNWEKKGLIKPLRVGVRGDRKYRPEDVEKIVDENIGEIVSEKKSDKMSLTELKQFLWQNANILRGRIDSGDYKKYIFGLLFYKRMSDIWDEEYQKALEEYHDKEIAKADFHHRFQVPKDCRWEVIENQAENIGSKLNNVFEKITNANQPKLDKIFDELNFANKDIFTNDILQKLISNFSEYSFGDNYISSDVLGDAYEYLIAKFAEGAGKKGGEFYTPREVEKVIINILKPEKKDHIMDPTVGSGGFLLEAYSYLKRKESEKIAKSLFLYGQEINLGTYTIAKINMFLHGLDSADIRRGDTLADPQFLNQDGTLKVFDKVVANFPYAIKEWHYELFQTNKFGRLGDYEMPAKKNADYAFILHIIKSLNEKGKAGIVVPHGVLFKSGVEGRIREKIIKNDLIEAVISMPSKLFFGVGIPVAILILNKNKVKEHKNKIFFIEAENDYLQGKNQNTLRQQDVDKIVNAFDNYKNIDKYAKVVGIK
ncbi:N-6 DNA methylase, partial [Patescibacteria group bacterium]